MAGYLYAGGGVAAASWTLLQADQVLDVVDPHGIANGTVTMSGNSLQIPVSHAANRSHLDEAYVLRYALPTGLADGSDKILLTRLTFDAAPSAAWGIALGWWDSTQLIGLAAGARYVVSTASMRPRVVRQIAATEGADTPTSALTYLGSMEIRGAFDGSAIIRIGGNSSTEHSAGAINSVCTNNTGTLSPLRADTRLIVAVTYSDNVLSTETLSAKCEYSILSVPS